MRGAGTSIAGNAVGPGIVVDTARHLNRVVSLDPEARTAVVQPGVVHATLQRAAAAQGLRFGPDPSTHTRCTVGGMIGNNACGSRALGYGRTADNVAGLRVAFVSGDERHVHDELSRLVDGHLAHVRQTFGRFSRQVSGYSLEHLLPENGRRLDRFLVGSEGTLGVVLEATVELVPDEPRRLVVLGYPSMADAADAVPTLLAEGERLVACEGLDARIVDLVRGFGWCGAAAAAGSGVALRRGRRGRLGARGRRARAARRRRSRRGRGALADPRGRRRARGPQPGPTGVLGLGGRRRTSRAARRLAPGVRRAAHRARPAAASPTATSATAACTSGSTSSSTTAGGAGSASSWSRAPTRCGPTAARSPASTATAGPGPSCCR